MKLWQKGVRLDPRVEEFTVGRDPELDNALIPYDCRASIAHATDAEVRRHPEGRGGPGAGQ